MRAFAPVAALIVGWSAACHPDPVAVSTAPQPAPSLLHVSNYYLLDVIVYAVRGGARWRLGQVGSMGHATFPMADIVWGSGTLTLILDPIGQTTTVTLDGIPFRPGQTAHLTVYRPLNASALVTRGGGRGRGRGRGRGVLSRSVGQSVSRLVG